MASYNFKNTAVYKKAFSLSMEIFEVSKSFPKAETYSLTDQIRRSSRSVCANLAEANKTLIAKNEEVGKLLYHMLNNPDKY